jgi:hypothetical protein
MGVSVGRGIAVSGGRTAMTRVGVIEGAGDDDAVGWGVIVGRRAAMAGNGPGWLSNSKLAKRV